MRGDASGVEFDHVAHFARALRRAGLPIGPSRVIEAVRAVALAGFSTRMDFYWTLQAVFVSRPEEREVFDQIFRLYWRDPQFLEHMMSFMIPQIKGAQEDRAAVAAERRAAEALLDGAQAPPRDEAEDNKEEETLIEVDASLTTSSTERLKTLDFELMSLAEVAEAKRMLARLRLPVKPLPSRRTSASFGQGRVDVARSLRAALRQGGDLQGFGARDVHVLGHGKRHG